MVEGIIMVMEDTIKEDIITIVMEDTIVEDIITENIAVVKGKAKVKATGGTTTITCLLPYTIILLESRLVTT